MKKIVLLILPFLLKVSVTTAQQGAVKPCYTDEAIEEHFRANPEARARYEQTKRQFNQDYANFILKQNQQQGKSAASAAPVYTIPVVFHILHIGGAENISDAQILNQMQVLNEDYAKLNADIVNTVASFTGIAADAQIVFKLATLDPNGNCTNGIVRHYDVNTDWTRNMSHYVYTWNPQRYMNVYVVKSITNNAAGYTFKPGTAPTTAADCIVMLYNYVGAIGTSNANNANTLTHEAGHWFNLSHTWGNTNNPGVACGDDGITDTPITKGYTSCALGSSSVCNAGIAENVQNYMDYSYCSTMFTDGQKTHMHAALNSAIAGRNNLSTPANLALTGALGTANCAPIADFIPNPPGSFTICSGQTITMRDFSYNGTISSYSWASSAVNTIATPNNSITNITFPNPGTYSVSLTVSNAQGSNTVVKNVTVLNGVPNYTTTYSESFENATLPPNWTVINQGGGTTWQRVSGPASDGTFSYKLDGTISAPNQVDILETGSYDFLNNQGAIYTFKYAYARYSTAAANADVFKVQGSSDCGGTWKDIYTPASSALSTGSGGVMTSPFTPTSTAQWKLFTLTNHPAFVFFGNSNVKFRFYFQESPNGFANNMYLDEINFTGSIGVNELTKDYGFALLPNPANNSATLKLTLSTATDVKVKIMDLSGRILNEQHYGSLMGEQALQLNQLDRLSSGVYLVQASVNGAILNKKLIIEH